MGLPIEEFDYWIRYMDLPPGIFAFVHLNEDGTYIIILDPRRSQEQILDSYIHELWHIINGDFYRDGQAS